ncbi:MAG: hypothetical protein AAGI12_06770 [Pseudomonadota bacterium]
MSRRLSAAVAANDEDAVAALDAQTAANFRAALSAQPGNVFEAIDLASFLLEFLTPEGERTELEKQAAARLIELVAFPEAPG